VVCLLTVEYTTLPVVKKGYVIRVEVLKSHGVVG
jgi:hypothetical protein